MVGFEAGSMAALKGLVNPSFVRVPSSLNVTEAMVNGVPPISMMWPGTAKVVRSPWKLMRLCLAFTGSNGKPTSSCMNPAGAVVATGVPSGSMTGVMGPLVISESTSLPGDLEPTSVTVEGQMSTRVVSGSAK